MAILLWLKSSASIKKISSFLLTKEGKSSQKSSFPERRAIASRMFDFQAPFSPSMKL